MISTYNNNYYKLVTTVLTVSFVIEVVNLSGLLNLNSNTYHALHLVFMGALVVGQLMLYRKLKSMGKNSIYALLVALGLIFTGIGDFVNGELSSVLLVSDKLTIALFLFGTGYILYLCALFIFTNYYFKNNKEEAFAKYRYLIIIPIALANIDAFNKYVDHNLNAFPFLHHGAFIFNATIYVLMPAMGMWCYYISKWSTLGLIVLIGTVLIPFSDLVLFNTWFVNGKNPQSVDVKLYATNWIVYFGGQALFSIFPSFASNNANN
jgi:hypothetical protein